MMIHFLTILAFVPAFSLQAAPVQGQSEPPELTYEAGSQLTTEQRASLRCSAAFALIAHGQSIGNEAALQWPKLETRGREFFVRTTADLMEKTGMSRQQITQVTSDEANALINDDEVETVMPSCLILLEASGV